MKWTEAAALLLAFAIFVSLIVAVSAYRELRALRTAAEEVGRELKAIRVLVPGSP